MLNKKNCAGTYPVRGYKRSDGTEVSAYMRSCGAKHVGDSGALIDNVNYTELDSANKHYCNPKTLADWVGYLELNYKSDALYHKYYKIALDYENQRQFNKDNLYLKGSDIKESNIRNYIITEIFGNKISHYQFDSMNVVVPQYGSPLVQKTLNSYELKHILKKYYNGIKNGQWKNKAITIRFYLNKQLALSIGNGLLFNMRVKNGRICGSLIDYYNFKKGEYEYNIAYTQQATGNMTNYLLIFPINIPVEDIFK